MTREEMHLVLLREGRWSLKKGRDSQKTVSLVAGRVLTETAWYRMVEVISRVLLNCCFVTGLNLFPGPTDTNTFLICSFSIILREGSSVHSFIAYNS